jgi:hypothetical protein
MTQATDAKEEANFYTERYVAFVDVLGFSALIERSKTEPEIAEDFISLLGLFQDPEYRQGNFQITSFSDSILASIPANHDDAFSIFVTWLAIASLSMAAMGYPVRGAVARGLTYHNEGVVFGPAVVRAYQLETRTAIYPRIIFDPRIDNDSPVISNRGALLKDDRDGILFVHYLAPKIIEQSVALAGFVNSAELAAAIVKVLSATVDQPDVLIKHRWLRNYVERYLGSAA